MIARSALSLRVPLQPCRRASENDGMRHRTIAGMLSVLAIVLGGVLVRADTLVLRDGRRIHGELRSVRNGVIEFEEDRGRTTRTVRFDQDEVRRIEFDDQGTGSSSRDTDRDRISRPSGLREREIVVSADVAWNDTGIEVRSGQTVYFEATGRVAWAPGRRDGPAGQSGSPSNPNRPIPNRPGAALIGKIGNDSTDYFFIGDEKGPIRMRAGGRLYLGINDDYLADNSSNFRVTVYY